MFGSKKSPDSQPQPIDEEALLEDPHAPKGRPTPSRREAEAARRAARRIPADPKAARKAQKARLRAERQAARVGMMQGDERYLPPRDQGPVRAFVRDWIDSRRRVSEFFVFIAVGILIASIIPNPSFQSSVSVVWFAITIMVALEMVWTLMRLNRELKSRWPDKAERRGTMFYAGMRALQIRKLRVPSPRVTP